MRLYHFTAAEYLRGIAQEGLTVGDVPTDIHKMRGRIGVWLTSTPTPAGHGLAGSRYDKAGFRIEVDLDDNAPLLARWSDWSVRNVTPETRRILNNAAANETGQDFSDSWWVYFAWIRPDRIIGVSDTETGEAVEDWANIYPSHMSLPAVSFRRKEIWQKKMLKDVRKVLADGGA